MKSMLSVFIFILLLFHTVTAQTSDSQTNSSTLCVSNITLSNTTTVDSIIHFYQQRISAYNGPQCLFLPTCSQFFLQAVHRYGLFWATLMTVDRTLYRENRSSMKFYHYNKRLDRAFDPVYHNYIFNEADYYK